VLERLDLSPAHPDRELGALRDQDVGGVGPRGANAAEQVIGELPMVHPVILASPAGGGLRGLARRSHNSAMATSEPYYSMGKETLRVPMSLHAEARRRLVERLRRQGVSGDAIVLLQGGQQLNEYDTDRELLFMQESFFQYLFGVKEPGFYGAVEVGSGRATLFMPRLAEAWAVWMGRIHPPEHFRDHYAVDDARYVDELASVLGALGPRLLLLQGRNTDSDAITRA